MKKELYSLCLLEKMSYGNEVLRTRIHLKDVDSVYKYSPQDALFFRLCPGTKDDTIAGIFSGPEKMLSVRMEHTVWHKITYGSLRGPLSNPLYQNTQGKIFIFHFIFSSKFKHISDIYPNAPTHSNLPMCILSGFISQNKLCESQGEMNELVYEPELVYGFEITHSDGSEDNSDGSGSY